jgi:hypothetical protein
MLHLEFMLMSGSFVFYQSTIDYATNIDCTWQQCMKSATYHWSYESTSVYCDSRCWSKKFELGTKIFLSRMMHIIKNVVLVVVSHVLLHRHHVSIFSVEYQMVISSFLSDSIKCNPCSRVTTFTSSSTDEHRNVHFPRFITKLSTSSPYDIQKGTS